MLYDNKHWPFRWFGFFKEYGKDYINYPSIYNFIDIEINESYEKDELLRYLRNGIILSSTSLAAFSLPFTKEVLNGSVSVRTDGNWLWLDNICEFIQNDNLILPNLFYEDIKNNCFLIPEVSDDKLDKLDWPMI